jgi:hypothetical protein
MAEINFEGFGPDVTVDELANLVAKMRKELNYALKNLDSGNLMVAGIDADRIKTDQLVVGDNISMGPEAMITWGQITDPPSFEPGVSYGELYTVLGEDYVITGKILADSIYGGTFNVGGLNDQFGVIKFYDATGVETGHITNSGLRMKWLFCDSLTLKDTVSITSDATNKMALNATAGVFCPSLYASNSLGCGGSVGASSISFNSGNSITSASGSISANANTFYTDYAYFSSAYVVGNISVGSITDRTPFYEGDALFDIKQIKGMNGEIDHSTIPGFARKRMAIKKKVGIQSVKRIIKVLGENVETIVQEPIVEEVIEDGRDLGAMVTLLTSGIQQLIQRVESLEALSK